LQTTRPNQETKAMSIGAVNSQAAAIYAARTTDADMVATTDPDKDSKPKAAPQATPAAPAGSFFASALMNVLINEQASGSSSNGSSGGGIGLGGLVGLQTTSASSLSSTNLLGNLTDSDRDLIKATGTTLPDDDQSNDTSGVPTFVLQIAADRMTGRLTGDVTPDYLQHLATLDSSISQPIDPQALASGMDFLNGVTT
jgi:hypothetical protein